MCLMCPALEQCSSYCQEWCIFPPTPTPLPSVHFRLSERSAATRSQLETCRAMQPEAVHLARRVDDPTRASSERSSRARTISLTPAPTPAIGEEQLQNFLRGLASFNQIQQLQIQIANLQTAVQTLQSSVNASLMRDVSLPSALPSRPEEAPAEEEDEQWPLCGCGNFAPRNQQWCRACKDAWAKKQAKNHGKGKK